MPIQRRGFLTSILAAGMAPTFVKAGSLMKIVVPSQKIILLPEYIFKSNQLALSEKHIFAVDPAKIGRGRTSHIFQIDELGFIHVS